jgi:hypothetical protein
VACLPFLGSALTQVILWTIWNIFYIFLLRNMLNLVVCTLVFIFYLQLGGDERCSSDMAESGALGRVL